MTDQENTIIDEPQIDNDRWPLDDFMDYAVTNRSGVLNSLDEKIGYADQKIKKYAEDGDEVNKLLYEHVKKMLCESKDSYGLYHLMELDASKGWTYEWECTSEGISLRVEQFDIDYDDIDYIRMDWCTIAFSKLIVPAKYLSVSEYAKEYDVEPVTVRQWIRRGKLTQVKKAGSEWYISYLCSPKQDKHYTNNCYSWEHPLSNLPEEYSFLANWEGVDIMQDNKDKKKFLIYLWPVAEEEQYITMDTKTKEKFEYYLLSNPEVNTLSDYISL